MQTQIWGCVCDNEAVLRNLVKEVWTDDDDAPLSAFVASQGQVWLDHDFMETLWAQPGDTLITQFNGAYELDAWAPAVTAEIAKKDLVGINGLILVGDSDGTPQIAAPRDAEGCGWKLVYLGNY